MAACLHCDSPLTGRRRVCDACKAMPKRQPRGAKPTTRVPEPAETLALEVESTPPPAGLHARGRALWADLGQKQGTLTGELALEACRMVDRLNELDRIVAGKGVLQLMKFRLDHVDFDDAGDQRIHVTVGFQSVLMEGRLQQTALKDVLKELRAAIAANTKTAPAAAPGSSPATPAPSPLDQLAARRVGREQATAGT